MANLEISWQTWQWAMKRLRRQIQIDEEREATLTLAYNAAWQYVQGQEIPSPPPGIFPARWRAMVMHLCND